MRFIYALIILSICLICSSVFGESVVDKDLLLTRLRLLSQENFINCRYGFIENEILLGDGHFNCKKMEMLLNLYESVPEQNKKIYSQSILIALNTVPLSDECLKSERLRSFLLKQPESFYFNFFTAQNPDLSDISGKNKELSSIIKKCSETKNLDLIFKSTGQLSIELTYLILKYKLTEENFISFLKNSKLQPIAIDAILFSPHKDYYIEIVERHSDLLTTQLSLKIWTRTLILSNFKDATKLLNELENKITGVKDKDGKIVYSVEKGRIAKEKFQKSDIDQDVIIFTTSYLKIQQHDKLKDFFLKNKSYAGISLELQKWLLTVKHPDVLKSLLEELRKRFSNKSIIETAFNTEDGHLFNLLQGAYRFQKYFKNPEIDKKDIDTLISSNVDTDILIGIRFLGWIAQDKDLEVFKKYVYDKRIIEWKDHRNTFKGPLIAFYAVDGIFQVGSDKAISLLNELVATDIDKKVKETIKNRLEYIHKIAPY